MKSQELEELRVSIYEKLRRAIQEGDKEKALSLLDEVDQNRNQYRNIFLTWVDVLHTYIAEKVGEDAVYETNRILHQRAVRPTLEGAFGPIDAEARLRKRAYVWSSIHGASIDSIEEDNEKFTITFKCPTGGAIRTREHFGKTKEAHPWSYGEKGFCYYCTHCVTSFDIANIEEFGYPAWITLLQSDGRCIQRLYKNPEAVPEKYYRRVGMKKPEK